MSNTSFKTPGKDATIQTSIAPWLSVSNCMQAFEFYSNAFNAVETYRLESPGGGMVARLSVNGAAFWLSSETEVNSDPGPITLGGNSVRMILTVQNPDELFEQALKAGAQEIFPVGEGHGWRLGRLVDPFGLHWEIGHPLKA